MSADSPRSASTAREAVLAAFAQLERATGRNEFGLRHVVDHILTQTSGWRESTLRTHIANHMCIDAPEHLHADLERVCRGSYRRLRRSNAVVPSARPAAEPDLTQTGEILAISPRAQWLLAGEITLNAEMLACPPLPASPGIYRLTIVPADGGPPECHIGESENLRRRVNQYRMPGVSQLSNIRLNERMTRQLACGDRVEIHVITEASASYPGGERRLDLGRKDVRRLFESLALMASASDTANLASAAAGRASGAGGGRAGGSTPGR
jgi:hypothetical protein